MLQDILVVLSPNKQSLPKEYRYVKLKCDKPGLAEVGLA